MNTSRGVFFTIKMLKSMLFNLVVSMLPSLMDFLKKGKKKRVADKLFNEKAAKSINDFCVAYNVAYDAYIDENELD